MINYEYLEMLYLKIYAIKNGTLNSRDNVYLKDTNYLAYKTSCYALK